MPTVLEQGSYSSNANPNDVQFVWRHKDFYELMDINADYMVGCEQLPLSILVVAVCGGA